MSDKQRDMPREGGDSRPDLGRRGLLTGAFLTRQGRENVKRSQKPLGPRPPWHQQVMGSCGQCKQECVASCPQKIISLHPDEHEHAGTPWLDFSATGCTFCGDCAEACPSIESFDKESFGEDSKVGSLQLASASCLTWNNVFCMSCIGKCDVRALQLDERRRLILNDSLCTGCGMCVHSCPVNALAI